MFGGFCGPGNSHWGYPGNFGVWGWIGLIVNLIFWVVLITGLILLFIWAIRHTGTVAATGQPTTTEILQTQYARGEITREQYESRK